MAQPNSATCDECGSPYRPGTSEMAALCPECAHVLYGHEPCSHEMVDGSCTKCLWDGSRSEYVRGLQDEDEGTEP